MTPDQEHALNTRGTNIELILRDHVKIMNKMEEDIQSLSKQVAELTLYIATNPSYGPIK